MAIVLHQFEFSHFNEKARWALDFKEIPHDRISYLPGPHRRIIQRLTGQSQTPVLEADGEYTAGSAAIIDRLEVQFPDHPLYPEDGADRAAALTLQDQMDGVLGPAARTVVFSALIGEGAYVTSMFARGKPALKRGLYRAVFPLARGMIAKGNGVDDPDNVRICFDTTADWLDSLAARVGPSGHLVGDRFSVADLTAAALLAPIADVEHADMRRPRPIPGSVTEVLNRFTGHPTLDWVRETYARHRPIRH